MFGLLLKQLAVDTSSEEIRRVTTLLEQHNIKYDLRTARTGGVVGSGLDAASYARANLAMYKGAAQPTFVYTVYVRRKDFELARKLVSE